MCETREYDLLLPVEACTAFTHPNLWAWRELLHDTPDGPFVVVFVSTADALPVDDLQATFLALSDNTS